MPTRKEKTMPKGEGYVFPTEGKKISEDELSSAFEGRSVSFDAHDITSKIIEFGKALTGVSLYKYQEVSAYAIIYSVITFSGDVKTMLFSRQSGKSEVMAFVIDTLCVLLPALAKIIPDLEQFKDGFRIGLFAPQSDQVTTTYSRALTRIRSANAEMVLNDPDIDVYLTSTARLELSNGSYLAGQVASKQSKIESKTYDLVIVEEAQDVDDFIVSKSIEPMLSSTGGTLIKVGTTGLYKNHFYYEIQHNRQLDRKLTDQRIKNHFEFDYKSIIKDRRAQYEIDHKRFHLLYEADILRKRERWGEDSQAFKLAYALIWDLESGMMITDKEYNGIINRKLGFQEPKVNDEVIAGLDIGKSPAETVFTIGKKFYGEDRFEKPYVQILAWFALGGMDYETQHHVIMDIIVDYNVSAIYADYTGVGKAVVDRLMYACGEYVDITPYTFTAQSKSDMWFNFISYIQTKHLIVPANKAVRATTEYMKFEEQMKNCTKYFNGSFMVCEKAEGYFDDFCLSSDTEILTENGFKGIDTLTLEDTVASYSPDNRKLSWVKPLRKIVREYSGEMYNIKGEHIDQLVSPHHKVLYYHRTSSHGKTLNVLKSGYAKDVYRRAMRGGIPNKCITDRPDYPITDNEITLMGWFITEGWINRYSKFPNYYRYMIGQSLTRNPQFCEKIANAIRGCSLEPHISDKKNGMRFWQFHKADNDFFDNLLDNGCHRLPSYWRLMSARQLNILYRALMDGDGCWSRKTFSTDDYSLAMDFSELCKLIGKSCFVKKGNMKYTYKGVTKYKEIFYCYVAISRRVYPRDTKIVPYEGKIWCVNVNNGYIVIRRNGIVSITGNCDSGALMCLAANEEHQVEEEMEVLDNPLYSAVSETIGAIRRNSYKV